MIDELTETVGVFDVSTGREITLEAEGQLTAGVAAWIRHQYAVQKRKDIRRGRRSQVAKGFDVSNSVYGYDKVRGEGGTRRVINKERAAVIREICEKFAADGIHVIARSLNDRGVPTPRRSKKGWSVSCVREFLRRSLYRGQPVEGKTHVVHERRGKGKKRRQVAQPEQEWVVTDAPELRIVSEDLARRVDERFRLMREGRAVKDVAAKKVDVASGRGGTREHPPARSRPASARSAGRSC